MQLNIIEGSMNKELYFDDPSFAKKSSIDCLKK